MKLRGLLLLLVSLALAGVAALSANRWMASRLAASAGSGPELSEVAVAGTEIPFGTKLDATMVKMVGIPPQSVPEGAFQDPESVIGRIATYTIYKGEILLPGRVKEHLGGSALAAVVEEGQRAITIRVDDVRGVAGFLLPGNRVDVIAIKGGRRGASKTRTILQNMKVLAVDQTTSTDKDRPVVVRAVTLQATPKQAEEIAKAQNEGKLQLTLRNPLDSTHRKPDPVAQKPDEKPAQEPTPPPKVARSQAVQVLRGTASTTVTFGDGRQATVDFAR